ncbi:MAG: ferredoxin family protein [Deltaproteobacteria bacterium]|nr:ferredoxin family protein [Deltaproteobacteria bacterium]
MPPVIDEDKCTGCGVCADVCPMDVFYGSEEGEMPVVTFEEECWHCNSCVLDCPVDAVSLRIPLSAMMLHMETPE